MSPDDLKSQLSGIDAREFCWDVVFSMESWLFDESGSAELFGTYEDFRTAISHSSGVPADDIRLVGSSRFGVSMSPKPEKLFREFNDQSDLDVIIVSEQLFSEIWGEFLRAYYGGYSWIKGRHGEDVFRRFIYLLGVERYETDYLRDTSRRLDGMKRQVLLSTGLRRKLKYRIYHSWEAAVDYHASGVMTLQRMLEHAS